MKHIINVKRYSDGGKSTLGLMFLDNEWNCYTLEDTYRKIKIYGQTRIPEGTYKISICTWGEINDRYNSRYPGFHKGMLMLNDVPGFDGILIHQGNTDVDTEGCILVGSTSNDNKAQKGFIGQSDLAYQKIYKKIINWLIMEEDVWIEIETIEPLMEK